MANACECGCGELLPETSTRQYKRGHKQRTEKDATGDNPAASDEWGEAPSINDVAESVPNDPEPKTAAEHKPKANVRVTASIRKDIEGKLAFGFGMVAQTWSLVDPVCGTAAMQCGPDMAKKYTPLICQSPDMVRWLSKGGNFLLWVDAFMATMPLLQVAFAHHIAKSASIDMPNGQSANGNAPQPEYVVQ